MFQMRKDSAACGRVGRYAIASQEQETVNRCLKYVPS